MALGFCQLDAQDGVPGMPFFLVLKLVCSGYLLNENKNQDTRCNVEPCCAACQAALRVHRSKQARSVALHQLVVEEGHHF